MSDAASAVEVEAPAWAPELRLLGRADYQATFAAMKQITLERPVGGRDMLWICEHPPVFTQGIAGRQDHLLLPGDIPVVQTDRGGQVTYHGPGQVVAYPLIDLRRAGYFVKEYVYRIEESVLRTLAHFGVTGHRVAGAPGIYVRLDDPFSHAALTGPHAPPLRGSLLSEGADSPWGGPAANPGPHPGADPFRGLGKIAALGIKVSRHCTYHGVSLNVAMDLEPFSRINPCGYAGLRTVDLSTIGVPVTWDEAAQVLSQKLVAFLAP
ncbi:Octanoyltransferase [Xylophilus ampelinus]|nr:lipoyl(octanoyl) transferase LipB [Variovorax sp.]VTY39251.1 Octanoyltransferase [Xylophilus ampelinus]